MRFSPEKWLRFRRGGAAPVGIGFAECVTGGKALQQEHSAGLSAK